MEFYRKVTSKQYSYGKGLPNLSVYEEQARTMKQEREAQAKATMEAKAYEERIAKESESIMQADYIKLEGLKRVVTMELAQYIPIMVMNEFFSRVVINALPHDEEFIESCKESIVTVNKVYLHHLGGFKYLKEQAQKTKSNLLSKLCRIVKENTDIILTNRLEALKSARTEDEVNSVMNDGLTADETEKLDNDIDELNPDEIAEMVQNKVLTVVKDEAKKQSEESAFKAELQNRAKEYDDEESGKLNTGLTDAESADSDDQVNEEVPIEKDEEPKTESAKFARYILDPSILHETSLFNSLMVSNYRDMIKAVKESDEGNVINPQMVPKVPLQVSTSPLNLNMFDVYLNDYQDDLRHVDNLRIANKKPLAGAETRIDVEDVLAESLMQYTMLETAMTIKLITPTPSEVRMVAEYNMTHK